MTPTSTLRIASWTLALCAAIASAAAGARIVRVGPGGDSPTIAGAARIAQDGDTVEIAAGTYAGDVAVWLQRKLTIRAPNCRKRRVCEQRADHMDGAEWNGNRCRFAHASTIGLICG